MYLTGLDHCTRADTPRPSSRLCPAPLPLLLGGDEEDEEEVGWLPPSCLCSVLPRSGRARPAQREKEAWGQGRG